MGLLVDSKGQSIPDADELEKLKRMEKLMTEIMLIVAREKADINDMASLGLNFFIQAFRHVPRQHENEYVNNVMQMLAVALGQATIQKRETEKAANEIIQHSQGAVSSSPPTTH